jgi:hypothetical protein
MTPKATSLSSRRSYGWLGVALVAGAALMGAVGLARRSGRDDSAVARPSADGDATSQPAAAPVALATGARVSGTGAIKLVSALTQDTEGASVAAVGPVKEAAPTFASAAAELQALRDRLPGERVTLRNRTRAHDALRHALDGAARPELELRRAALELKQREQAERVAHIEQRISQLEQP